MMIQHDSVVSGKVTETQIQTRAQLTIHDFQSSNRKRNECSLFRCPCTRYASLILLTNAALANGNSIKLFRTGKKRPNKIIIIFF